MPPRDSAAALAEIEREPTSEKLLTLEGPPIGEERPVVKAKVVYLGNMRNKSLSLRGRVMVERVELPTGGHAEKREATRVGRTPYDFATHDTLGRLIRARMMPAKSDPRVAGRRWEWCEHSDHLLYFDEYRRDGNREFLVVFDTETDKRMMDEYATRVRRTRTRSRREMEETIDGRAGIR